MWLRGMLILKLNCWTDKCVVVNFGICCPGLPLGFSRSDGGGNAGPFWLVLVMLVVGVPVVEPVFGPLLEDAMVAC